MQSNPIRQITRAGVDRTRRAYVVHVAPFDDLDLAPLLRMRAGMVVGFLRLERAEVGRFHSERIEDAFLCEFFPRSAGRRADGLPRGQKHDVLILECRAKAKAERDKPNALDDLLAAPRRTIPEHVVTDQPG